MFSKLWRRGNAGRYGSADEVTGATGALSSRGSWGNPAGEQTQFRQYLTILKCNNFYFKKLFQSVLAPIF